MNDYSQADVKDMGEAALFGLFAMIKLDDYVSVDPEDYASVYEEFHSLETEVVIAYLVDEGIVCKS